ncbi:probable serine/threonine-protein kinase DDB_G0271682 [Corticium candelabrum]|uniref:probable serine/threonine-protein kinase DDB_G0271682 n=1 Tax=Corticium candelabrum TaxID=121492 RepID=UPI002E268D66|nr:probable serine/threonine-protein kinase DDB_G0271682 [Corticium candelabrum]
MASQLDDNERQLQQQEEELDGKRNTIEQQGITIEEQRRQMDVLRHEVQEMDVMRHEAQEKHTINERLARDLQRSESAVQELQQLQHQYDSITLIHDDSLHMTGLKLGEGAYGEVGVGMWSGVAVAVKTFHEEPVRVDELNVSFIQREVSVSSRIHHPNVVSICGAIIENEM